MKGYKADRICRKFGYDFYVIIMALIGILSVYGSARGFFFWQDF